MNGWLHQCPLVLVWLLASAPLSASPTNPAAHWAYQPIRRPTVPVFAGEPLGPIDAFVTERLRAHGLDMSPSADRRTLIRRVSFDLIGLPPSFEEIEAFVADQTPDAYARLVDRLLASPHYGERWGRHWLDVARYAETKDLVLLFGKDRLRPYAYTYRDYVVRALNEDTPYDRFVEEQIAADQLEPTVEKWRLAALGFLTLGRLFDNNIHDQIDDQIDTVTRGFLGLTVACARCHNHKYDPIPIEDYYSLYGVFSNCESPYDPPLIENPARVPGGPEFERALAQARRKLQKHVDSQRDLLADVARERVADYLVRVVTTKPDFSETSTFLLSLSPDDLRPGLILNWRRYLEQRTRKGDPVFGLWAELMDVPETDLPGRVQALASGGLAEVPGLNPYVAGAFLNAGPITNRAAVARFYGELLAGQFERFRKSPTSWVADDPAPSECELLDVLEGNASPCSFPPNQAHHHMARVEKDKYGGLVLELDKLAAYAANPPPARAMVVEDTPELHDARVFVRGNPARLGPTAPRQFLKIIAGDQRRPFSNGSGRLDLARAMTASDNPLTSRVMVNRVWMHHFGEPLVSSPSDFGARSDPPSHPELLDYLAWRFQEEGWSLKKLHREILASRAYQQSSQDRPEARRIDPENRWVWRANRRRLDFESMRDAMLFVSGRLDTHMWGRSVNVAGDPSNRRRTLYGVVDRQDLPAAFRAFDFACPDQSVERRPRTIVPQQALFAMNSPFVILQARSLASAAGLMAAVAGAAVGGEEWVEAESGVSLLYQTVLGRIPERDEADAALQFLRASPEGMASPTGERLAQVLLMSNEFMFVD